jgi:exopolysaccharide biosynthesis WecB/TagA/CpsF family protein
MGSRQPHSVYLVGWPEQHCEKVKAVLEKKYPEIKIVGYANVTPDDQSALQDIRDKKPDLLLVAFGPIKQERWIARNFNSLPVKVAIGLGGSFDYAIGKKIQPPKFIREAGLEWLYRLFTQPTRIKRIYQAFWGLIISLVRYKVFGSLPFRRNGTAVVINKENKIFLGRRKNAPAKNGSAPEILSNNYWQFPQGGLDNGEETVVGTSRELEEETGMTNIEVLGQAKNITQYDWSNANRSLFSDRRFRGQEQHTVFFRYLGSDEEIELDTHELVDYKWLSPEEVLKQIAGERLPHAEIVLAELAELLRNK